MNLALNVLMWRGHADKAKAAMMSRLELFQASEESLAIFLLFFLSLLSTCVS